jgi:hypothetical protein
MPGTPPSCHSCSTGNAKPTKTAACLPESPVALSVPNTPSGVVDQLARGSVTLPAMITGHGAVVAMQRGMRVVLLGVDYGRYNRFEPLTPQVYGSGKHRQVQADAGYAPTREEYGDCTPVAPRPPP